MYNEYFGFKESPFSIAPDPRYLYMTEQHREALAHLVYGLNSEGGCILLTGEVGTGKTTVCRCLLEQIPEQANIALVFNPKITALELLETICDELHIEYPEGDNSIKTYIDRINAFLLQANAAGQKTVLIIDEAQNMDSSVLEQLRLLTNLETNQRKLLQVIILGQPELLAILSRDEMRQLAQRITARFHLNPLSSNELKAYISHRLAVAGSNVQLFHEKTINKLYRYSKGVPRVINILCDRALLGTYVQNKPYVDVQILNNAAKEVFGELKQPSWFRQHWPAMTAVTASLAAVAVIAAVLLQRPAPTIENTAVTTLEETTEVVTAEAEPAAVEADDTLSDTTEPEVASTAIETAATSDAEPDVDEAPVSIAALFENAAASKAQAYTDLFDVWDKQYSTSKHGSACKFAGKNGLSCLHRQGNLRSLEILNRPAVLKLYDENNTVTYAILTRLEDNVVTLRQGSNSYELSDDTLNQHWLGEYTLLWQKPPYYQGMVQPGSKGPIVQWLDQQMVRLYGQKEVPTIHDTYNNQLMSQIIRFQQSKGIIADGVAGPNTFILLNSELETGLPQLNTREG